MPKLPPSVSKKYSNRRHGLMQGPKYPLSLAKNQADVHLSPTDENAAPLVAGSTGSGKTVCINAVIASLCYFSSPEGVQFIMVDPKIVEMKVYNDLTYAHTGSYRTEKSSSSASNGYWLRWKEDIRSFPKSGSETLRDSTPRFSKTKRKGKGPNA